MNNLEKLYREANESITPSPDFTQRTMDRIFSEGKAARFHARKTLILIAAVILLLALGACTAVVIDYIANRTPLSENTYYSSASDQYASSLDLYAESGGVEIVLTEAVFENNILTMTFDYEIEGYDYLCSLDFFGELRVDGRECCNFKGGECKNNDLKTWYVMEFDLTDRHLTGVHDFELTVRSVDVRFSWESPDSVTYNGLWKYSFSLDTGVLTDDTVVYSIDRYVTLNNGDEIYLDKIVCNPMTQRLLYRTPLEDEEGFLPFCDVYAESSDGTCDFRANHNISGSAQSLNFTPDLFDLSTESFTLKVTVTDENGISLCEPFEVLCRKKSE